jgi:16S rRNA processing protein RimM
LTEDRERRRPVGRVGRPHGLEGAFRLEGAEHPLHPGTLVRVGGRDLYVKRHGGSTERPIITLEGVDDRSAVGALRGMELTMSLADAPLGVDEWLADDLVGCRIEGVGEVRRVVHAPSCDLLEAGAEGTLIPFVRDAVRSVDLRTRSIEVDRTFLGLGPESSPTAGHEAPLSSPARSSGRSGSDG